MLTPVQVLGIHQPFRLTTGTITFLHQFISIFYILTLLTLVSAAAIGPNPDTSATYTPLIRLASPQPGSTIHINTPLTITWSYPLEKPKYSKSVVIFLESRKLAIKEYITPAGRNCTASQNGSFRFVWRPRADLPQGEDYLLGFIRVDGKSEAVGYFKVRGASVTMTTGYSSKGGESARTVTTTMRGTVTERKTVEVTAGWLTVTTTKIPAPETETTVLGIPTTTPSPARPTSEPSENQGDGEQSDEPEGDAGSSTSQTITENKNSAVPNNGLVIPSNTTETTPIPALTSQLPAPRKEAAFGGDAKMTGGAAVGILFAVVGLGLFLWWVTPLCLKRYRRYAQKKYNIKYGS